MGYLEGASAAEPTPVIMYDGAIGRGDIGPEVTFVSPTERFRDGSQLKVLCCHFILSFSVPINILLPG